VWLQNALVSAYGLELRRRRYGPEHERTLRRLRASQWRSGDELARAQLAALNGLLAEARLTVPFYAGRLPVSPLRSLDELRTIPILTKSDVRRAGLALVSGKYARRRLHVVHTGGTTGTPLPVYCTRTVLQRNYAFFARFREWVGVPAGARVATFAGRTVAPPDQMRPPYWRRNWAANTLLCSSYHIAHDTVAAYVEALAQFAPMLIDSYPSSVEPIARFMRTHGLRAPRPQAVITSSETLDPPVRRLVEHAFGCPVFDHYGAAEMAAFITQCRAGVYHVNPEFGIVEILRDGEPVRPGEAGEIVATGFINPVMPLIRYATGDVAVRGAQGCSCGRAFPVVERLVGRTDDVLVTPEGRRIGRLDPIFKSVASLVETRIVQDAVDHVRVETVTDGELPAIEQATLMGELRNRLGPSVRIDVIRVPRIARTSSGKFRAVVNLLESPEHEPAGPHIGPGRS
ncbi:MAG: hypothetical protein B7Z74_04485, partial [Deltaproteobacteria bacterium 21-66-5]